MSSRPQSQQILPNEDPQLRKLCPRLLDYLCIVGTRNYEGVTHRHAASVQPPELLRRYPPEDHKDFPLPLNMVNFCQPEGCLTLGPKKSGFKETTAFVFTLTDKDSGLTRYGVCLNFFRPVEVASLAKNEAEAEAQLAGTQHPQGYGRLEEASEPYVGFGAGDRSEDSAFSSDYRSSVSQIAPSDSEHEVSGMYPPQILPYPQLPSYIRGSALLHPQKIPSSPPLRQQRRQHRMRRKEEELGIIRRSDDDDEDDDDEDKEVALAMTQGQIGDTKNRRRKWTEAKQGAKIKPNRIYSLTSLCLLSHHPFISNFRECLRVLRGLIEVCEAAATSPKKRPSGLGAAGSGVGAGAASGAGASAAEHVTRKPTIWSLLIGCEDSEDGPVASSSSSSSSGRGTSSCYSLPPNQQHLLMHDVKEIETWILRLLSAPVPVPGRTRVELDILPRRPDLLLPASFSSTSSTLLFALPDNGRFSLCDYPLHLPLELLGVDTCLVVLTLILLEKKLVLQSRDYSALSISILSLTQLIYPLEYMFPVIPLLPTSMNGSEQLLLAPTPFIIGLPMTFLACKRNTLLPDDVWLVDLDAAQVVPPKGNTVQDLPSLPEPEAKVLKNHLKQSLASMSIQPIKNFDELPAESLQRLAAEKDLFYASPSICGYNPFIYGNDVDSVDVATRVAMVRFFNSPNLLSHFHDHTRTLRLYPRPIVAFQTSAFLKSRTKSTLFTAQLCQSQAVEYFAEWALMPTNQAYRRVQGTTFDPRMVGDKPKWYAHELDQVQYTAWDDQSSLAALIRGLHKPDEPATDESGSDSEALSSSSSCSSLSDLVTELVSENEKRHSMDAGRPCALNATGIKTSATVLPSGLKVASVYKPPKSLHIPGVAMPDSFSRSNKGKAKEKDSSEDSAVKKPVPKKPLHVNVNMKAGGDPGGQVPVVPAAASAAARVSEEQPSSAEVEKLTTMMGNIHNNNNTFMAITKESLSQHNSKEAAADQDDEKAFRDAKDVDDEVFSSESEDNPDSVATTKTMKNSGSLLLSDSLESTQHPLFPTCKVPSQQGNGSIPHGGGGSIRSSASPSFGSDLSLSEITSGATPVPGPTKPGPPHQQQQRALAPSFGGSVPSLVPCQQHCPPLQPPPPTAGCSSSTSLLDSLTLQARGIVRKEHSSTQSLFGDLARGFPKRKPKPPTPIPKSGSSSSSSGGSQDKADAPEDGAPDDSSRGPGAAPAAGADSTSPSTAATTEDVAQELFHNIELLTQQAKQAASGGLESLSLSRSGKGTLEDLQKTSRSTFEDFSKTALSKKRDFFKALGATDALSPGKPSAPEAGAEEASLQQQQQQQAASSSSSSSGGLFQRSMRRSSRELMRTFSREFMSASPSPARSSGGASSSSRGLHQPSEAAAGRASNSSSGSSPRTGAKQLQPSVSPSSSQSSSLLLSRLRTPSPPAAASTRAKSPPPLPTSPRPSKSRSPTTTAAAAAAASRPPPPPVPSRPRRSPNRSAVPPLPSGPRPQPSVTTAPAPPSSVKPSCGTTASSSTSSSSTTSFSTPSFSSAPVPIVTPIPRVHPASGGAPAATSSTTSPANRSPASASVSPGPWQQQQQQQQHIHVAEPVLSSSAPSGSVSPPATSPRLAALGSPRFSSGTPTSPRQSSSASSHSLHQTAPVSPRLRRLTHSSSSSQGHSGMGPGSGPPGTPTVAPATPSSANSSNGSSSLPPNFPSRQNSNGDAKASVPGLVRSNSTLSTASNMSQTTAEYLTSLGTELTGLATTTTNLFGDLFVDHANVQLDQLEPRHENGSLVRSKSRSEPLIARKFTFSSETIEEETEDDLRAHEEKRAAPRPAASASRQGRGRRRRRVSFVLEEETSFCIPPLPMVMSASSDADSLQSSRSEGDAHKLSSQTGRRNKASSQGTRPSSPSPSLSSEPPSAYSSLRPQPQSQPHHHHHHQHHHHRQKGPFPRNRRGLAEKSSLIRHPSSKQYAEEVQQRYQQQLTEMVKSPAISPENHTFLKDLVEGVFNGDGISWLRNNRLRKLMEDENYRNLALSLLGCRTISKSAGPEDHVEDVCLERPVWKGMLKVLMAVIHGLEVSVANSAAGGVASAFHVLEIAHTHYWINPANAGVVKNPPGEGMSNPGSVTPMSSTTQSFAISGRSTSLASNASSPFGSRDNLSRVSNSPRESWASTISATLFANRPNVINDAGGNQFSSFPMNPGGIVPMSQSLVSSNPGGAEEGGAGQKIQDGILSPNGSLKSSIGGETSASEDQPQSDPELKRLINAKKIVSPRKAALMNRMASLESNITSAPPLPSANECGDNSDSQSLACSETGSFIANPAFRSMSSSDVRLHASMRSVVSDSELEQQPANGGNNYPMPSSSNGSNPTSSLLWQNKSALSAGHRFHAGRMVQTSPMPGYETMDGSGQWQQVPTQGSNRTYLFEGILSYYGGGVPAGSGGKSSRRGSTVSSLMGASYGYGIGIWESLQFWEDVFCDAIAQERDVVGMDSVSTTAMLDRYRNLTSDAERKRLEHDEDRLLATMLYNLTAYMIMMGVRKSDLRRKVRRLMGKCHIGLAHSQEINLLLDNVNSLGGNDVDLKPLPSRQMNRQTFTVHAGTSGSGDLHFLEVREDGLVLRSVNGVITERWFYERLVNMTFSPKTRVICLWRRTGGQTQLNKYYTKKCKELYYCIKESMERAAARGSGLGGLSMELGGEFPVEDLNTGEGGLLQVCMEGIGLLFANSKFFVRLDHIRKCFTQRGGIFVLEEFNPKTRQVVQRRYSSAMADQICYSVLCVFSYVAAGQQKAAAAQQQQQQQQQQHQGGAGPAAGSTADKPHRPASVSMPPAPVAPRQAAVSLRRNF